MDKQTDGHAFYLPKRVDSKHISNLSMAFGGINYFQNALLDDLGRVVTVKNNKLFSIEINLQFFSIQNPNFSPNFF